jgi:hypothetical protein
MQKTPGQQLMERFASKLPEIVEALMNLSENREEMSSFMIGFGQGTMKLADNVEQIVRNNEVPLHQRRLVAAHKLVEMAQSVLLHNSFYDENRQTHSGLAYNLGGTYERILRDGIAIEKEKTVKKTPQTPPSDSSSSDEDVGQKRPRIVLLGRLN